MTKEQLLTRMREGQRAIPEMLPVRDYVRRCVEVMFDVAAEALAEPEAKASREMQHE
jgi:hypothetical protein